MTVGAHPVPVLIDPGPVQLVVVGDLLVGVEVKPALAALVLRPGVPSERQRLEAAAGEGDQVLLQRVDAEGVVDLVVVHGPIGTVRLDEEAVALAVEARGDAVLGERDVGEVAQHRGRRRDLHRLVVLRAVPSLRLGGMAAGADRSTDEGRGRVCRQRSRQRNDGGEEQGGAGLHHGRQATSIDPAAKGPGQDGPTPHAAP